MQFLKRMIAMVLALSLCVGMVPVAAYAQQNSTNTTVNNDVAIKSNNGFGTLLSKKMQQHQRSEAQAQEDYIEGYCVSDLTVSGNIAAVEYCALEDAVLTVAIYSEDGLQLITSATVEVSAEDTVAELTLEGQLPEYFMASAFLMDGYDFSPLCAEYATSMYTREMQELLKSTVDDYPAELVLNLDDNKDTNFAVYAENVKIIEASAGVNKVVHEDHDTQTYVIANADGQFTSLAVGDVFSYNYEDNEYLIVKIASISVDGTTVTITGGDLEMEEVFTHVKIEMDSADAEITVDDSTAAPGIDFVGFEDGPQTFAIQDADRKEDSIKYVLSPNLDGPISMEGSLTVTVGTYLEYYLALTRVRIKLEIDLTVELEATLEVKTEGVLDRAELPIGFIGFTWMGLVLDLTPELVVELSGEVTVGTTMKTTFGIDFDDRRKDELIRISKKPVWDVWKLEAEVSLFFGIDLSPELNVISEDIAGIELGATVGVVITASVKKGETIAPHQKAPESKHACEWCVDFELKLRLEIEGKVNFLNIDFLSISLDIGKWEVPLGNMYYSIDKKELGPDKCPNLAYRLTLYVVDEDDQPLRAAVRAENDEILGNTNDLGTLVLYVPAGNHTFKLSHMMRKATKNISVTKASLVKITLKEGNTVGDLDGYKPGSGIGGALGKVETEDYQDLGILIDTGKCGDSAYWDLYSSGIMIIHGSGHLDNSARDKWYEHRNEVRGLIIDQGIESFESYIFGGFKELISLAIAGSVKSISFGAFSKMEKLKRVQLGNGVTSIESHAFYECTALRYLTLPDSLTTIGDEAFVRCQSLTDVEFPDNLESIGRSTFLVSGLTSLKLPDSMSSIGDDAFKSCGNLVHIELNEGLESIGAEAFSYTGITDVVVPESVRSIGERAFANSALKTARIDAQIVELSARMFAECKSLISVNLPDSVTSIGESAFYLCKALESVNIPAGVTSIGKSAFESCRSLDGIVIPNGVTTINESTFQFCEKLSSINIPNGVTGIGDFAFMGCRKIPRVILPQSVTSIGEQAFASCDNLTDIELNEGLISIGAAAFQRLPALTVRIPGSVRNIGQYAFEYSGAETVIIDADLTEIPMGMFARCWELTSVVVPDSVTSIGHLAFEDCHKLVDVTIPEGVTSIGEGAFKNCKSIESITIPDGVTEIGLNTFYGCEGLNDVVLGKNVNSIGRQAFSYTSLDCLTIPASVSSFGDRAFAGVYLSEIVFEGSAPKSGASVFVTDCAPKAYYPANDETWTLQVRYSISPMFVWTPYTLDENGEMVIPETASVMSVAEDAVLLEEVPEITDPVEIPEEIQEPATVDEGAEVLTTEPVAEDAPVLYAIHPGEYETEETAEYSLKKASFTGLVPGEDYILLALLSTDGKNPLSADNLLYITQGTAENDGTLKFQYVQPKNAGLTYVMACGPSNLNLKDAYITFPEMYEDSEFQTVTPTVTYGGKVLTEGVDYEITGDTCFSEAGTYSCTITGMYQYAGSVTCDYTVKTDDCSHTGGSATCSERAICDICGRRYGELDAEGHVFENGACSRCGEKEVKQIPGDIDGNEAVDVDDVLALLWHVLFPDDYTIDAEADFDGNGMVDVDDVLALLWHVLFPDDYPI